MKDLAKLPWPTQHTWTAQRLETSFDACERGWVKCRRSANNARANSVIITNRERAVLELALMRPIRDVEQQVVKLTPGDAEEFMHHWRRAAEAVQR
jgi:hypothetical protein